MTQSLPKLRGNRLSGLAALCAILFLLAGCGASTQKTTPTPTFTPAAGSYSATQSVTVSDTNQSAVLYCTNDGSTPTASSVQCANPITVSRSQTLKAIAIAPGMDASAVATASYTIATSSTLPTVTAIGPVNGPASGGTSVTILGTNFTGAIAVDFGTVAAASYTVNSATSITAISPAGTNTAHVTVTTSAGRSTTSSADVFAYDPVPVPAVTGVVPSSGSATGGASVTITGNNFTGATAVSFGTVAATSFTVNSSTSITAIAPAGSGTVDVKVTTAGGISATSAADQFTYISLPVITGVSPAAGPAAGGTIVAITGSGFTGATAVNFGASAATSYIVNSSTSITAVSPAGSGTVDVKVLTPVGLSATSTADQFTFVVAAPEVAGISPSSGPSAGGTSVAITGTNFSGVSAVYFGTVAAASFKVNSKTSITAVSPASSGTVDVTVVGPGGTSDSITADLFTYILPTLSGTVVSGPLSSGTPINATVYLYAAGTTGYGTGTGGSTEIAHVKDIAATGKFSEISYDCSTLTAPGDQLYLVAQGSTSGTVLMTALGSCNSISSSFPNGVTINEATTTASAYALAQFASINSTAGIDIGAPATAATCNEADGWKSKGPSTCNYIGLKNAFAKVNNLVDIPSGTALSITPYYNSNPGSGLGYNYSQAPQARVHALANALASCSNPASGNCTGLFTATTVNAVEPKDTLQAALNMAQNPGSNVSAIYTQASAVSSFTPTLTAAPADWTLAIIYQGGGLSFGRYSSIFGYTPTGIAIDANGNVWIPIQCIQDVAAANSLGETPTGAGTCTVNLTKYGGNGSVAVFSNLGVPLSPSATPTSAGGFTGAVNGTNSILNPQSLAIDQNGYAWIGNYPASYTNTAGSVTVLDVNGNVQFGSPYTNSTYLMAPSGNGIAVDKNNNVWVSSNNVAAVSYGQFYFCGGQADIMTGGSILALSVTNNNISPVTANGKDLVAGYLPDNSTCPGYIKIDQTGNIWSWDDGSYKQSASSDYFSQSLNLWSTSDGSLQGGPYMDATYYSNAYGPVAIDSSDNGWSMHYTTAMAVNKLANFAGQFSPDLGWTPASVTVNSYIPRDVQSIGSQLVLDGNSNAWIVGTNKSYNGALYEFYNADIAELSPTSGYQAYDGTGLHPASAAIAAVDNSGNVWLAGSDANNGILSEFVGIAAPVQTPLVNGLINGNNLGSKP